MILFTTLHPRKTNIFFEKVIILGDFKIEVENKVMKSFLQEHTFYNIMKQNTCFKGDGGWCRDLLITNLKFSFMEANSFETGLSDHDLMIYTILKKEIEKFEPKISKYAISNNIIVNNLNGIFLLVCLL